MSASLVGSEMCIRDRVFPGRNVCRVARYFLAGACKGNSRALRLFRHLKGCLLYTSDAADDM
eukprot:10381292-Alexandrium_andersonii.AAC.1